LEGNRLRQCSFGLLMIVFAGMAPCKAEDSDTASTAGKLKEPGLLAQTRQTMTTIVDEGKWDIYLSGYAHHSRDTYSDRRIEKLNEQAWGFGFGKTFRNSAGNDESLYALVIRDSNRNLQWSAGYAYQWMFPLGASGLEAGAGLSAGLIQRRDWFDGVPFPAVLPVFSAGGRQLKLMGTYVPHLSTRKGKGDVLLLVLKYSF
jgi:palmitoyl transferase